MSYDLNNINYEEGMAHMQKLTEELKRKNIKMDSFYIKGTNLRIEYPGRKQNGDYRLYEGGDCPTHTDIVREMYQLAAHDNLAELINCLDDIYIYGLHAKSTFFPESFRKKIFWMTLQEEINYPQPRCAGRKLPFQRYYEAALAAMGVINLDRVFERTNNHDAKPPRLLDIGGIPGPSFYQ